MKLTTEDLGEIADVKADELARIVDEDAFGAFAVLSDSDDAFMQAGNNWSPDDECEAFVERHGSDPWVLEYRDAASGKQFQATRNVTLQEVRDAFLHYLRANPAWRDRFQWSEIDV